MNSNSHVMNSNSHVMNSSSDLSIREIERRETSSTIVREEYLTDRPQQQNVVYVEVPVIHEVEKRVPKIEVVEVENRIPKYEYEWVDKVVEIPQIEYVDKQVMVPHIQEVIRHVHRREIVDVPRELVRHVSKIENVVVEKFVEVPGPVVNVPKPYVVEKKVPVPRYIDNEVAMVVCQTVKPVITETDETIPISVVEYEPQVVIIDVHVPKPVPSQLIAAGLVEETHNLVTVPAAQYNTMLLKLNPHIPEQEQRKALPFTTDARGAVPFLSGHEANIMYPAPVPTADIRGWMPGNSSSMFIASRTSGEISH